MFLSGKADTHATFKTLINYKLVKNRATLTLDFITDFEEHESYNHSGVQFWPK